MADKKLTELAAVTTLAESDPLLTVSSSASKKITAANLRKIVLAIQNLVAATTLAETDDLLVLDGTDPKSMTLPNFRTLMGNLINLKDFEEEATTPSSSAGVLTLNMELGNSFDVTLDENVTSLVLSNPPATGNFGSITLILRQDGTGGFTFAWLAAIKWDGGTAPTISSGANEIDIYTIITRDAGTTWFGFTGGQAFA